MAISLEGQKILIADDEPIIALDLAQRLEALGAEPIFAHDFPTALRVANFEQLSAAVIDLKLKDHPALPVCEILERREIPFLIYTGYEPEQAGEYAPMAVRKPDVDALLKKLAVLAKAAPKPKPQPINGVPLEG